MNRQVKDHMLLYIYTTLTFHHLDRDWAVRTPPSENKIPTATLEEITSAEHLYGRNGEGGEGYNI